MELMETMRNIAESFVGRVAVWMAVCLCWSVAGGEAATLAPGVYRGWDTQCLSNELVQVHVVAEAGGRVVQFKFGDKEFLWVNPALAGKVSPASGLTADGEWLNYGGDKLWPAPQGWDGPQQWPGPPDAVLDGQAYGFEVVAGKRGEAAVKLTSGEDRRSGIQFSRVIRISENSTRVAVAATMKNIDDKPRRWGIWAHTQLDAAAPDRSKPNRLMRAWCPIHPGSRYTTGYDVIFGDEDNRSFGTDWRRGLVEVNYRYEVGKIGVRIRDDVDVVPGGAASDAQWRRGTGDQEGQGDEKAGDAKCPGLAACVPGYYH